MENYSFFEHDADIGIEGFGDTPEQAFVAAAEALFSIECNLEQVTPQIRIRVKFDEADPELALVRWLNLLLSKARAANLALCRFDLSRNRDRWRGEAWGDCWRSEFERGVEVKGATLTMLCVAKQNGIWRAACVVDV